MTTSQRIQVVARGSVSGLSFCEATLEQQVLLAGLQNQPQAAYPTPFLGYLVLYAGDTRHKVRYPKRQGYRGLGMQEY